MEEDLRAWLYSVLVMVSLSLAVFLVQLLFGRVLNIAFEVCVFYLPTVILLIIYVGMKARCGSR